MYIAVNENIVCETQKADVHLRGVQVSCSIYGHPSCHYLSLSGALKIIILSWDHILSF